MWDLNMGSTMHRAAKEISTEPRGTRTRYCPKAARRVPAQGCSCAHTHRQLPCLALRCLGEHGHRKGHQKEIRACCKQGALMLALAGYCWSGQTEQSSYSETERDKTAFSLLLTMSCLVPKGRGPSGCSGSSLESRDLLHVSEMPERGLGRFSHGAGGHKTPLKEGSYSRPNSVPEGVITAAWRG